MKQNSEAAGLSPLEKEVKEQEQTIRILKEMISRFNGEMYRRGPVNERNAGRKPIITVRLKEDVHKLKNEHMTIRAIADELKISVGTVHKIIHMPME